MKKKTRKFALGGFADLTGGIGPMSLSMQPRAGSGGGGGAYGGLDTVNKGSQQIGQSLQTIGDALGKPGEGGSPGIGKSEKILLAQSVKPIVKKFKKGGSVSSASKRADGIAIRGKTRA